MNLPYKKFEQIWFLPRWSEKIIASSSLVETFRTQSVCVCPNKPVVSIWNFFLLSLLYLYRQNIWTRGQQGYGTVVSRVLPDLDKKITSQKAYHRKELFWVSRVNFRKPSWDLNRHYRRKDIRRKTSFLVRLFYRLHNEY